MFFENYLAKFSWIDWIGLAWFLACWLGYELVVERGWSGRTSLLEEMRSSNRRVVMLKPGGLIEENG